MPCSETRCDICSRLGQHRHGHRSIPATLKPVSGARLRSDADRGRLTTIASELRRSLSRVGARLRIGASETTAGAQRDSHKRRGEPRQLAAESGAVSDILRGDAFRSAASPALAPLRKHGCARCTALPRTNESTRPGRDDESNPLLRRTRGAMLKAVVEHSPTSGRASRLCSPRGALISQRRRVQDCPRTWSCTFAPCDGAGRNCHRPRCWLGKGGAESTGEHFSPTRRKRQSWADGRSWSK